MSTHQPSSSRGRVLVAMSGGVDSSVAAALLMREGYEVVGCFMRLGSEEEEAKDEGRGTKHEGRGTKHEGREAKDEGGKACPSRFRETTATTGVRLPVISQDSSLKPAAHQGCCSVNDAADARTVAGMLGVGFYVLNFRRDFGRIMDYFVAEYNAGRTPNPCVRCNDWLKFGKLHDYAQNIDADFVASGHYAQVVRQADGSTALLRGVDESKDQSYVLFGTPMDRLNQMLLPIGGMKKSRVREIARELGLPVFDKPDSQEICFVPDRDYAGFVRRRSPGRVAPGKVLDRQGEVVGEHDGQQAFTIGQRRGVGVSLGYPIYVIDKNAEQNSVTVGPREDLYAQGLLADQTNWLIPEPEIPAPGGEPARCAVKIRYNSPPAPATVSVPRDGALEVRFDEPQFAIAPGQAVVCYQGQRVMGGGWIREAVGKSMDHG